MNKGDDYMTYNQSIIELIKKRTSVRTYETLPISQEVLKSFESKMKHIQEEMPIKAKFHLMHTQDQPGDTNKKVGTYGVITGATTYIVTTLDQTETDAVAFGYFFEKVILLATDLGLDTCWLGGTFKKSDFSQVKVSEEVYIPIVTPLGIRKQKPRVFESAMRAVVGANKRKPWEEIFFDGNRETPLTALKADAYQVPLEMVRLGPSASNKQPWRIIKNGGDFHFFLSRTKGYAATKFDMQLNDMGIAKCHFEQSAIELGLLGAWHFDENVKAPNEWQYVTTWSSK